MKREQRPCEHCGEPIPCNLECHVNVSKDVTKEPQMKNDITEKILEIIYRIDYVKRNRYLSPMDRQKMMAKEISVLFEKFIEWAILHKDLYIKFGNIDELYEFWQNLPENKRKGEKE